MDDPGRTRQERIDELLAKHAIGHLSLDEAAELDALRDDLVDPGRYEMIQARAAVAFDRASSENDGPSASLRSALVATGRSALGAPEAGPALRVQPTSSPRWPLALAAMVAISAVATVIIIQSRAGTQQQQATAQLAAMRERAEANDALLAQARGLLDARSTELADAMRRATDLADRLARESSDLDTARLRIAALEAPVDPAEIQENRRLLLEVPGTVRLAWSPFDLPDAPAEQPGVQGDVVWNDDLQQGYLRFVGLRPNDPAVEQYQVWVIDERGLEQKVSGGVFNASAEGEVIVPIDPAIDVGRVALFAITVENPGGTWVPDLTRRVVVAPRS